MEKGTKKCPYCGEEILAVAKKCKYCGEWLTEQKVEEVSKQMIPCPICSEMIEEGTEICPHCNEKVASPNTPALNETRSTVSKSKKDDARSFFDYYLWDPFFRHYLDFKGRLNRKHYWLSILMWFIIISLFIISTIVIWGHNNDVEILPMTLAILWYTITLIPLYATASRRLRDADSQPSIWAWLFLICASPLLLIWTCKSSEDEDIRTDNLVPDTPKKTKFKTSDFITIAVLIFLNLFFIYKGFNDEPIYNIQSQTDNMYNKEEIKEAYIDFLTKVGTKEEVEGMSICQYFLYDITGDGIPELWLESGTCEADHTLSVLSYNNYSFTYLDAGEEGNASNSSFYRGDDYILQVSAHMGYAGWTKISYSDDRLQREVIFEEDLNESGKDDYTEPSEDMIESHSIKETLPINTMFDR